MANEVWCADLTYIRLPKQFGYLAVLMDIFTRSIRGWELAGTMLGDLPKAALLRALESHRPEVHHSDQGVQYAATGYVTLLQAAHAQIIMAAQGVPTGNGSAERLMRTLQGRGGVNRPPRQHSWRRIPNGRRRCAARCFSCSQRSSRTWSKHDSSSSQ